MTVYPGAVPPLETGQNVGSKASVRLIGTLLGITTGLLFIPTDVPGFPTQFFIEGIRLRIFDFVLVLWVAQLALTSMQRGRLPSVPFTGYFLTFIAFIAYGFVNAYIQAGAKLALKELIQAVEFVLFIYLIATTTTNDEEREDFFNSFLYSLITIAIVNAVLHHLLLGYVKSFKLFGAAKLTYGLATFFLVIRVILERRSTRFMWWLGLLILCFFLMILSLERKGWIAVVSGTCAICGIILAQNKGDGASIKHRLFFGMAIGIPIMFAAFPLLLTIEKFNAQLMSLLSSASSINATDMVAYSQEMVYESNLVRAFLLEEATKAFLSNPIFGLGPNGLQLFIWSNLPDNPNINGAHNEYLAVAVENGSIGLILYLSTWFLMLREAIVFTFLRTNHIDFHDRLIFLGLVVYGIVISMFLAASAMTVFYVAFPIAIGLTLRRRILLGMHSEALYKQQSQQAAPSAI